MICPICKRDGERKDYANTVAYIHETVEVQPRQHTPKLQDACFIGRTNSPYSGHITVIRKGLAVML